MLYSDFAISFRVPRLDLPRFGGLELPRFRGRLMIWGKGSTMPMSRPPYAPEFRPRPAVFGTGLVALDLIFDRGTSSAPLARAGGTCANVLTALSFLGWASFPIARLADDSASGWIRDDLRRFGVALDFVSQAPAAAAPVVVQTIHHDDSGSIGHRFSLTCPACGARLPRFRAITKSATLKTIQALAGMTPFEQPPSVFFLDRTSPGALLLAKSLAARNTLVMYEPAGVKNHEQFREALAIAQLLKYSHADAPQFATFLREKPSWLLEIETFGAAGLRFRSRRDNYRWHHLDAVRAPEVVDTAGAGDWCSAGLVARLCRLGLNGLAQVSDQDLIEGLRFGQAAAAVACGYKGARGAMYQLSSDAFMRQVEKCLAGRIWATDRCAPPSGRQMRLDLCLHGHPWRRSSIDFFSDRS